MEREVIEFMWPTPRPLNNTVDSNTLTMVRTHLASAPTSVGRLTPGLYLSEGTTARTRSVAQAQPTGQIQDSQSVEHSESIYPQHRQFDECVLLVRLVGFPKNQRGGEIMPIEVMDMVQMAHKEGKRKVIF